MQRILNILVTSRAYPYERQRLLETPNSKLYSNTIRSFFGYYTIYFKPMKEHDNIMSVKVTKQNGNLIYKDKAMKALHKEFIDSLVEGQTVEIFFEAFKDDGSNLQLAKIHACIRKLAHEIGFTFEEMKKEIKRRSGLAHGDLSTPNGYVKSFGDCSSEELSLVIQTIIEAGDFINVNFRGKLPMN